MSVDPTVNRLQWLQEDDGPTSFVWNWHAIRFSGVEVHGCQTILIDHGNHGELKDLLVASFQFLMKGLIPRTTSYPHTAQEPDSEVDWPNAGMLLPNVGVPR